MPDRSPLPALNEPASRGGNPLPALNEPASPLQPLTGLAPAGGGFLDIDPAAISSAAHLLRGLAVGGPVIGGPAIGAGQLAPAGTPGPLSAEAVGAAVPGVGRFLAAADSAAATQSARVAELAAYAGSAAAALDWMAGTVTGTDGLSSAALDGMMPA